jgi:putative ABC transport system permease protein
VAAGLAIGLAGSLLGALIPLAEVASISPAEAARKLGFEKRFRRPVWLLLLSLFSFLSWAALARLSSVHRPEWSFLAALAALLGFLFLTPIFLKILVRALEPLARRLRLPVLLVSCGQLAENPYRYGVVTAALSLGVALWLGVGLMVHSFRASVADWVKASIRGDVYLILRDNVASGYRSFLPPEFLAKAASLPGVAHRDTLRMARVEAGGREVPLSAIKLKRLMAAGIFKVLEGDRAAFARDGNSEDVAAVAESFARRMGIKVGDRLTVATEWGAWTLAIGAVLYDYTSERGQIFVDAEDFARRTGDARVSGLGLFLEDPSQSAGLAAEIRGWENLPPSLEVNLGADIRARVLRIFDETFQVTEALKYVAVFVALLGIISTLSIVFEQKRWELGLLAALGLAPAGLKRYGLSQGLLLSAAGFLVGLAAGLALCGNIIHLIHKNFFGWTILFSFDAGTVLASLAVTTSTGAAASFFLIRKLSRLRPAEALRYDE